VFIEVKTRRTDTFGAPGEAVTRDKQRRMARAARHYIQKHRLEDRAARFDVIEVLLGEGDPELIHLPDAFDAASG
jgi:putative endonuclease